MKHCFLFSDNLILWLQTGTPVQTGTIGWTVIGFLISTPNQTAAQGDKQQQSAIGCLAT
jgi:hypothetical protein